MGLLADIYEPKAFGNSSNHGISSTADHVCIVNAKGPFNPHEGSPGVEIIPHPASSRFGMIAVPVDRPEGRIGPMFGGTYIFTSDSRLKDLGVDRPVPLHDRFETQKEYDLYSR